MSSSTGSGDVVDEGACWPAEAVVEGDCCGEGKEACADAGCEAMEGAGAVAFEGEEVFAGLEDRFDPLPDRRDLWPFARFGFAFWPDDRGVEQGGGPFELAAGLAEVADHEEVALSLAAFEQRQADVAFGRFRRGEDERTQGAVQREQAVQPEAPEVAAVACAVAVVGRVGELAAPGRFDRAGALDRGRVDQHQVVVEAGAITREDRDQRFDRAAQPLPALEIPGPVRQGREQVQKLFAGRLQEPRIRRDPHHRLSNTKRDDLRVGQHPPGVLCAFGQEIVGGAEHRKHSSSLLEGFRKGQQLAFFVALAAYVHRTSVP
jgi:hypothetical protein